MLDDRFPAAPRSQQATTAPAAEAAPDNAQPAAPVAAETGGGAGAPQSVGVGNVKETIESILIAFILAFVFRAFVVEAFVIPTGSMAPTLLGAHMRYRCPDCGYEFDVNYQSKNEQGDDIIFPDTDHPQMPVHCPNCGYLVSTPDETLAVHYGDRILVLKYLYLLNDPHRWDVVVFKSPADPKFQLNYIKRLIGKPGESIMVLDGDVYVKAPGGNQWQIQTKPDYVQDALWRVIYDNDHYPQQLPRRGYPTWHQPWTVRDGGGWDLGKDAATGRVFHFDNATGSGTLVYDPAANPLTHTFNEYLVYDVSPQHQRLATNAGPAETPGMNTVSDLKLRVYYERKGGDGPLRLRLTKLGRTFTAEITPAGVRLLQSEAGSADAELIPQKSLSELGLKPHEPVLVEFQNVDYRVSLRLNGREVLATTPAQYHPDMKALIDTYEQKRKLTPPSVEVVAERQVCSLAHVGLWRDIYYTNREVPPMATAENGFGGSLPWASPENPVVLGPDEYFVLGDNSVISGDARYWQQPIKLSDEDLHVESGRVPGRFLLGKAFFVYWPAGFRPREPKGPAVVPNFGDMRFIH